MSGCFLNWCSPGRSRERLDDHHRSREALRGPQDGTGPVVHELTPLTFHTIIGLIACTGLRRSEATGLLLSDLGPDGLLVRNTKARRDRLVPLHESTRRALDEYLVARKRQGGPGEHLFVLAFGQPVRPDYLTRTFILLARKAGVRAGTGQPGLRLHDLRHEFAVSALEGSLSSSRRDVRPTHARAFDHLGTRQRHQHVLLPRGDTRPRR